MPGGDAEGDKKEGADAAEPPKEGAAAAGADPAAAGGEAKKVDGKWIEMQDWSSCT